MGSSFWDNLPHKDVMALIRLHSQRKPIQCPECKSEKLTHNPLDDSKYICRECGHLFDD